MSCALPFTAIRSRLSLMSHRSYQDPFDDYKKRLAKKLAKRAEAEQNLNRQPEQKKKEGDDINWFGLKVGLESNDSIGGGGGVGKYLSLKRPASAVAGGGALPEEGKKRKLGFGDFSNF